MEAWEHGIPIYLYAVAIGKGRDGDIFKDVAVVQALWIVDVRPKVDDGLFCLELIITDAKDVFVQDGSDVHDIHDFELLGMKSGV